MAEVKACCKEDLSMYPPLGPRSGDVFMGIDWGTGENSYTVLCLGRYLGGRFTYFYWKRFEGYDVETEKILSTIYQ